MILNLIIPAKTVFPGKVTLTGSRDQDVDYLWKSLLSFYNGVHTVTYIRESVHDKIYV